MTGSLLDTFDAEQLRNLPVGVFDSGFGGLTVVRALQRALPNESFLYVGDTARCPYGPREQSEVRGFVHQIINWLQDCPVKMVVIACNTATAAGLKSAQAHFDIPIVGVIEPGARSAVCTTKNGRVGVIATKGTIESGAYETALMQLNPHLQVISAATPEFVTMVEEGVGRKVRFEKDSECRKVAQAYLIPLVEQGIDTLVLGCTHFPVLRQLIHEVVGPEIRVISSAQETARDVSAILMQGGQLTTSSLPSEHVKLFTTGENLKGFKEFADALLSSTVESISRISFSTP